MGGNTMSGATQTKTKGSVRSLIKGAAVIAVLGLMLCAPGRAVSKSLWTDTSRSMFTDGSAQFVGDLITIVVSETTRATSESDTSVNQQESMNSGTGTGILGKVLEQFGIDSTDEYAADGTTTSRGTLTTTISAEVVEVLPNGNLVIEARRSIVINEETQSVVLSGVVRLRDITGDNQISSTRIANMQIKYTGRGPIARRQRPGLLNKIFNWIF